MKKKDKQKENILPTDFSPLFFPHEEEASSIKFVSAFVRVSPGFMPFDVEKKAGGGEGKKGAPTPSRDDVRGVSRNRTCSGEDTADAT